MKSYMYKSAQGDHFPDCYVESAEWYSMDFGPWLTKERDTAVSFTWTAPGMTVLAQQSEGNVAQVRIQPITAGVFIVQCVMESIEGTSPQTKTVRMNLKVY